MTAPKTGPLSIDEMREVWRGALDKAYREPIEKAGDGNGLEAHGQMWAQFARASLAIDVTTQAMFISPWSGQTNDPASGERKATVTLTATRSRFLDKAMVLGAGLVFFGEQTTDWGDPAGVVVQTGRRYTLVEDVVFHPGDTGPFDAVCEAELVGYGYNNPLPGTISAIDQPGSDFLNDLATVTVEGPLNTNTDVRIVTPNEPDMFVPDQVGQYVVLTSGANTGNVARITGFLPPVPPLLGSTALIAYDQSIEATTYSGQFIVGERATATGGGANYTLVVLGTRVVSGKLRMTFTLLQGDTTSTSLPVGAVITGANSGATATVANKTQSQTWTAEAPVAGVGGAAWRTADWVSDWGLVVTNALSPTGGRHAWLDELGNERNIHRAPGEDDDSYRERVAQVADTVAPNAIRRKLSRTLNGITWCFREVGTASFPGFFYDGDNSPAGSTPHGSQNDAYDTDVVVLTGAVASGTFAFNERVQLQTAAGDPYVRGYFGRLDSGNTVFTLVRTGGEVPSSYAGLKVVGQTSGAVFNVTAGTVPTTVKDREFHVYLDYAQFRGFFLICVPKLGYGEFGFAYDAGLLNAYDISGPYNGNFYDGFPRLEAQIYSLVYQAIDPIRAGGVLFDLKRGCEDCG